MSAYVFVRAIKKVPIRNCDNLVGICVMGYVMIVMVLTARAYATAVLGVVILSVRPSVRPSVCPSVCLSHACIVTKLNDAIQTVSYTHLTLPTKRIV